LIFNDDLIWFLIIARQNYPKSNHTKLCPNKQLNVVHIIKLHIFIWILLKVKWVFWISSYIFWRQSRGEIMNFQSVENWSIQNVPLVSYEWSNYILGKEVVFWRCALLGFFKVSKSCNWSQLGNKLKSRISSNWANSSNKHYWLLKNFQFLIITFKSYKRSKLMW